MKRWLSMIGFVLVLVLVTGGLWGYNLYQKIAGFKAAGVPRQTVSTMKADYQEWRPRVNAVGSIRAVRGADLSAEVAGIVDQVHFYSGIDVARGAALVDLRSSDDKAKLAALEASAESARITYQRDKAQFEVQAISQAQLDSDAATLKNSDALVAEQKALLEKKFIRAPFAGRLGIRAVDEGQYLQPGTKIVTLQTLDPIFVDFSLPQQSLGAIKIGQNVEAHSDTYPGQVFAGKISSIDAKVDTDTRNVMVRATFSNPRHELLPGMFATLEIETGAPGRYLTLPQTAVTFNPYGQTVFVITSAAKLDATAMPPGQAPLAPDTLVAQQVFVNTGGKRGDQIAVLKGLNVGDVVVTAGQIKLKNGSPVIIDNTITPANEPNPKPFEE